MKFKDEGIIIETKKYGEKSLIIKVFSHRHGIYCGFVRYVKSSKAPSIYQLGNLISFEYASRLEENLGSFLAVDLVESLCSKIIFERTKLECANSLFHLLNSCFLEREIHEDLFEKLYDFLKNCDHISAAQTIASYVKLELAILDTLGYGLDLSCCVVTNSKVDLAYVSPKSACAVSISAAKTYERKLLKLPNFLLDENDKFEDMHLLEGLKLSGFFLEKFLLEEKKSTSIHRKNILKSLE